MKIARIICWQLDSTLRRTMKRGFDIIPAQPELISVLKLTIGLIFSVWEKHKYPVGGHSTAVSSFLLPTKIKCFQSVEEAIADGIKQTA
ncbi:hypothetical protein [Microcoleus vaginatus]|uniref:hypothetical protein n=1 Tax=Microcoleus vaginatus TaxID=119532 RepID=UPI00403FBDAF